MAAVPRSHGSDRSSGGDRRGCICATRTGASACRSGCAAPARRGERAPPLSRDTEVTEAPALEQPWFHLMAGSQPAVLVVPGSMVFELDDDVIAALDRGDLDALV